MSSTYQTSQGIQSYLDFINSPDGQIFQSTLSSQILARLNTQPPSTILDAGCGNGWLSNLLTTHGYSVMGCDISTELIKLANQNYPHINFQTVDLNYPLPFTPHQFETAVFNVSLLDIKNLTQLAKELYNIIDKRLLLVTVNPYYGFPVGEWKHTFWSKLFKHKPHLKLNPYVPWATKANREFKWANNHLTSYFYTLPEQVNAFTTAGFKLSHLQDIYINEKTANYNLAFRLQQFPIFILMEFIR
jgi:SAM-dependent methyltransferase